MSKSLVVQSKVKEMIREKANMNTSASAFGPLSEFVEQECDKAIQNARNEGRKTVMDRDFQN